MSYLKYLKTFTEQKNPLKFILARILMKLNLSKFLIIKQLNYQLRFYPSSISQALWLNPNEPHTATIFFGDYLQSQDIIIDIGSNIGTITLESANSVGPKGKVYSIEPNPEIFQYLSGNVSLNNFNNIELFNVALGNKNGKIQFSNVRSDWGNKILENESGIKVDIRKLDDLFIPEKEIALIKIDIVGYEKFVLLGAKEILEKTNCIHIPMIEKHFQNFNYNYKDIFEILVQHGFELYGFSSKKIFWPLSQNYKPHNEDILAIKKLDDFIKRTHYALKNTDN